MSAGRLTPVSQPGGYLIEARDVYRSFGQTPALQGASVAVAPGEILAVMGPSGSGKSTLLHCLAGIFTPDSGEIWFDGKRLDQLSEKKRTELRRTAFGFVFQFGQLVPELTAADNVAIPLVLNRVKRRVAYQQAAIWLERLGLVDLGGRRIGELSGGQAQRVAVARALVARPKIVFADEPTGSLDSATGKNVMGQLVGTAREEGTTVVLVTHDARIAGYADREVLVSDGKVSAQLNVGGDPVLYRLGARLSLNSGREALTRLIVTSAAVAIGVTIMLAVLADFRAFQVTNSRPNWEGTQATPTGQRSTPNVELWNYSDEVFRGQTIERVDVAALGSRAPVLPGITRLPAAAQYYASPALAALLRTAPRDQLRARFPGSLIGTIGERALTGPDELVVFVGDTPAKLAALPGTIRVNKIANYTGKPVWTSFFRDAFVVGAIAFLFPILILIGAATKLSSARREERYAALRLVGATPRQVNVVASVDAGVSALFGSVAGIGMFLLVRPTLAGTSLTSARYFSDQVTPTLNGYLAVLVAVPAAAAIVTLLSLRRVRVSPLGVSRKVSPPPPRTWRIVPLIVGIVLFVAGLAATSHKSIGAAAFPGLLIIMIGLVVGGPWITARAARLLPRLGRGASSIFAAGRLADNPKAAFRSVSGLVLAVFLGTVVAGLIPAINSTTATTAGDALRNVLRVELTASPVCGNSVNCTGNPPSVSAGAQQRLSSVAWQRGFQRRLLAGLATFRGASVIPLYGLPGSPNPNGPQPYTGVIGCADLARLAVLGQCAPGATAVQANTQNLFGDNPMFDTQQIVNQSNPPVHGNLADLQVQALLVDTSSQAMVERVRTFLVPYLAQTPSGSAPRTFGEEIQARENVGSTVQRLVYIAVALTLLVAGCSLAVTVGGGLVERKRPFTLLRVTGTATATLYRVVLLEAVLPLFAATFVAAGTAYGMSVLIVARLAPAGTATPVPGGGYYAIMGAGLAASLAVILATLPLLGRITAPGNVRFE